MTKFKNEPGIYKITNIKNEKSYIGLSKNIKQRIESHKFNSDKQDQIKNKNLYWAFNEHGIKNFTFEVIEYCNVSELAYKEIYYIKKYGSFLNGYNSSVGGEGVKDQDYSLFLPTIPKADDSYLDMFVLWSNSKQSYFRGFSESDTPKWSKNIKSALICKDPQKLIDDSQILIYISKNMELEIKNLKILIPFYTSEINERFSFSTYELEKEANGEIYYYSNYTKSKWSKMSNRSITFSSGSWAQKTAIERILEDPEINISINHTEHNKTFKLIFYFFSAFIIPLLSLSLIESEMPLIVPISLLIYSAIFILIWMFIPYDKYFKN